MNKEESRGIYKRRIRNVLVFLSCFCLLLTYVAFKAGGWVLAASVVFAFSSVGVFSALMYSRTQQLDLPNEMAFADGYKLMMNGTGGMKTVVLVVFGITVGTVGIIALGAI